MKEQLCESKAGLEETRREQKSSHLERQTVVRNLVAPLDLEVKNSLSSVPIPPSLGHLHLCTHRNLSVSDPPRIIVTPDSLMTLSQLTDDKPHFGKHLAYSRSSSYQQINPLSIHQPRNDDDGDCRSTSHS